MQTQACKRICTYRYCLTQPTQICSDTNRQTDNDAHMVKCMYVCMYAPACMFVLVIKLVAMKFGINTTIESCNGNGGFVRWSGESFCPNMYNMSGIYHQILLLPMLFHVNTHSHLHVNTLEVVSSSGTVTVFRSSSENAFSTNYMSLSWKTAIFHQKKRSSGISKSYMYVCSIANIQIVLNANYVRMLYSF